MEPDFIRRYVIGSALTLMHDHGIKSDERAHALLLAIGYQESKFRERAQIGGPAIGFWQNELIFVVDMMGRPRSAPIMRSICRTLRVDPDAKAVHQAIRHNDTLAACLARMALWLDPRPLPDPVFGGEQDAWFYYIRNWRPGKPRIDEWPDAWRYALHAVRAA